MRLGRGNIIGRSNKKPEIGSISAHLSATLGIGCT